MAIISSTSILRSLSLFHLTLAFFFLTSPITIADQSLVFIIGEAMELPHPRTFDHPSAPLAFLAVVLAFSAVNDLIALSVPQEVYLYYWGYQAPVRLAMFFALAFYSYCFSAKSPITAGRPYTASSWGEGLKNRVVFSYAFVELVVWFWIFVKLRDERREQAVKLAQKRAAEENMM